MSDPISELAGMLGAVAPTVEVMGTAVAPAAAGMVQVQVGPAVWLCTDLPSRPATAGDTVAVRTGNAPAVTRNLTREKNPPSSGATDMTVSSGQYAWTDGTQMGTYVNELSAISRAQAADMNRLRTSVQQIQTALRNAGVVI